MSIFRVEKTSNYTVMSNYHLKEKNMSLKAIGLLSKMLSLPDDWDYSLAGLVKICKENETAIKNALNELKEFGYLDMVKKFPNETKSGRIEYEYIIHEKPKQASKKQDIENQGVEIQCIENPGQLNTKELNTKELNTKDNNINSGEHENEEKDKIKIIKANVKCIIEYLNESIQSNYKVNNKETIKLITARFNEGYILDDFYDVIDKKVKEWNNTEMEKYLRPSTLFGNKFDTYLNQKDVFKGTPKTSYGSKPTFDNTSTHDITKNNLVKYEQMTHNEKIAFLNKVEFKAMTKEQKEFYNKYCLVHDWDANIDTYSNMSIEEAYDKLLNKK